MSGSGSPSGFDLPRLFAAGGPMGARFAGNDWASTPLGPVQSWAPSLRTAVGICLHSPSPIALWWGPERVLLYNDAYRPLLGPAAGDPLGLPGAALSSPVWRHVGPVLDDVLAGRGAFSATDVPLTIDRDGYPRDGYFTFSCGPVIDESGRVGGVFTTVTETTARIVEDRRARLPDDPAYPSFVERAAGHLGTAVGALRRAPRERERGEPPTPGDAVGERADRRFRSLVEASTAVVWTADGGGQFVRPQPSWQAYTGQAWPAQRGDGWLAMLHRDDRATVRQAWRDAVTAGQRRYEATGRIWHAATGGYRHFVARATGLRDDAGVLTEWIGTLTDVHDRVTAESAAERSAAIAEALLTASPVGFGWVDLELRFQRVNPALCALNNLAEADHLGRRPSDVFPVDGPRMEELMRRALAQGPVTGVDISAVPPHRPRGGMQHVVASYFPIRIDGTEQSVGVGFTVVDVTERTILVEALGAERSRYDRLAATDVLAVFSGVGEQVTEANDAFLSMLGYTAEDLRVGRLRWPQLTPPGWEYADERAMAELERTGRVAAFDKEYLHRGGRRVPVLIGVVALENRPLRWLAYAADLSAERAAQAELRLFRALVERSGDFIAVADAEGHIVYLNPAGRELVGLHDAQAVRRTRMTDYAAPELRERWRTEMLGAAVRDGHARQETRLRRFDTGAQVDVDSQVFTVGDIERDGTVFLAAVARDATERQRSLRRAEALARFAVGLSAARGRRAIAEAIVTQGHVVFEAAGCAVAMAGELRDVLDVVSWRAGAKPARWHRVSLDGATSVAAAVRGNRTVVDATSICVPLRYGDGTVLGALLLSWPRRLTDEALANLLDTVTGLCSEALQRAELSHATEAMAELAARLSATRSTQDAVHAILAGAPPALGALRPAVAVREDGARLRVWPSDLPDDLAATYRELDLGDPRPLAEAVRTGQRILLPDREAFRQRYPDLVDHAGALGIVTTVALPLLDSRGRPVAALGMGWSRSRPLRDTDLALLDTIADLCEQTLERTRLVAAEHDLVTRMAGRLNATATTVPADLEVAVRYQPAVSGLNLGGDWYDLIALDGDRLAVVVGDVVGHHVEAAADMAQLRTIINTLIRLGVPLGEVFPRLTALLGRGFLGTALALRIDPGAGELAVTRAGHPNPVLVRAGSQPVALATANALPLGLVTAPMTVTTTTFGPGDLLVAYTDGLVERRSRPYDEGVEALHRVIGRLAAQSAETIADTILHDLRGSDDDQALVVIRRLR